ncbi:MAG: lysophospholipid acyltransferase family protein [Chthoniobacter sp.]|uniref:lysophospholipid acyltransferase family protein n=1 Tax=Chthoniobacter sp. TaxID=2510640 RepID=UPI0032AD2D8F
MDYACLSLRARRHPPLLERARWLHRWSQHVNRLIGLRLQHHGAPPRRGMIVSNHLGYLDVLAYSAVAPCVFVAKQEVAGWPVLGLFARCAGTIFVDRAHRLKVAATNASIEEALRAGALVVLFAEGTSSNGRTVLPFRSSLLEPVVHSIHAIAPAAVRYEVEQGSVSDEICYWGEMTLVPHLLNLLTKRGIYARIAFGDFDAEGGCNSRKDAARCLHSAVSALF